jgi:hypothetical protein
MLLVISQQLWKRDSWSSCPLFFFLILFIYISNVISFPPCPGNPLSLPHSPFFYEGAPPPTHPLPLYHPGIPLHWCIEPSQDKEPLLPLMPDKPIFCYICTWSHGSLRVYFLVGGLVPGSSGGSGWLILLFYLWVASPFSSFSPSHNSSTGDPKLSLMVGCEHLLLYS